MGDFEGFEFRDVERPKYVPSDKKGQDDENQKKREVGKSLEEIIYESRKSKEASKKSNKDDDSRRSNRTKKSGLPGGKKKVVIHVPRSEIQNLCKSLNIDTKGYYVKLEAVFS